MAETFRERVGETLGDVFFRDWEFHVGGADHHGHWLQVRFQAPDAGRHYVMSVDELEQRGRKWTLSPHMTRSEIVQTALKAVLAAVEHEAREDFHYRGVPVFGPHIDVMALLDAAERRDVRTPA